MIRNVLPLALLALAAAASAQTYSLTDLSAFSVSGTVGRAVNDRGQVTGDATTGHAFLYTPGEGMKDLGAAGGFASHGYGINASGQVAGYVDTNPVYAGYKRAFLSAPDGGALKDLGTLGGFASYANAVNASGQVVGGLGLAHSNGFLVATHSFISAPNGGALTDTSPTSGSCVANAVNDRGGVTGTVTLSDFSTRVLGVAHGLEGHGNGLNNSGQVTGDFVSYPGSGAQRVTHAFLTAANGGGVTDLGTLGGKTSAGRAVNDAGTVVGDSATAITSGSTHAFLYTATAGMRDLNSLLDASGAGWTLTAAYGLSNAGYITGVGTLNGQSRAFLLTPQAVPEPASFAALGLGALALLRRRRA